MIEKRCGVFSAPLNKNESQSPVKSNFATNLLVVL